MAGVPGQSPLNGVMVYLTVPDARPVLVNTSLMAVALIAVDCWLLPAILPVVVLVHVKVVPVIVGVKLTVAVLPLQINAFTAVAVTAGKGFTVTATLNGTPGQPFACGVMV